MGSLTIYKDDNAGSTVVSNRFIDEYMKDANDAQIKVYLYLLRMVSANLPTGISEIADKFNHTEKDVMRSLKYWEKCHLLALEFNEQKVLTAIRFTTPSAEDIAASEARPLAPIVPIKLVSPDPVPESAPVAVSAPVREKRTYSRDELKKFKEAPETSQILFVAETYLQRPLSGPDIETLYFINTELAFTPELIDYLLQYCIERDKKNFSYIKTVAINWAEAEITTPKQARAYIRSSCDKEVYAIMKALGKTGAPTPKEIEIITRWYKALGFSMEVINAACEKTVLATDSHRLEYCDKVLSTWATAGIHSVEDIAANDASYKKAKPQTPAQPKNSFTQFAQHDYDFDSIAKMLGN